ncbi:MAG TPA: YHS domain-containing (seleno)protein [Xanthobacteraceae bacterium]|nr:YHS domain-containing (seleno)protein [Xanthobacteraceae bacterium]
MTAARQKRKQYCACLAACTGLVLALSASPSCIAATTERIVVDWHTGLAIEGYDPVAFFTDGKSMPGSADFEFRYGGAIWRFCNVGNRDAFAARPDIYMPQFGGYDPLGVARGVAVSGNPNVWLITGERLFLFYDRDRLEKFAANSDRLIAEAERKWPDVVRTLSP